MVLIGIMGSETSIKPSLSQKMIFTEKRIKKMLAFFFLFFFTDFQLKRLQDTHMRSFAVCALRLKMGAYGATFVMCRFINDKFNLEI